jgi:hypothetical protein
MAVEKIATGLEYNLVRIMSFENWYPTDYLESKLACAGTYVALKRLEQKGIALKRRRVGIKGFEWRLLSSQNELPEHPELTHTENKVFSVLHDKRWFATTKVSELSGVLSPVVNAILTSLLKKKRVERMKNESEKGRYGVYYWRKQP